MANSNLLNKIKEIEGSLKTAGKYAQAIIDHTEIKYILPDGYQELDYIQASGNCYANTGYKPQAHVQFEGKFYFAAGSSSYPTIFGCRGNSDGGYPGLYSHNTSSLTIVWDKEQYGYGNMQNRTVYFTNMDNISQVKVLDANKNLLGSNTWSLPANYRYSYNMFLFALGSNNSVDGATYCSGYRIYYLKFYENNTLVRWFIPVKNSSGTPCFYDIVTETTITNAGSGSFVAGNVIG